METEKPPTNALRTPAMSTLIVWFVACLVFMLILSVFVHDPLTLSDQKPVFMAGVVVLAAATLLSAWQMLGRKNFIFPVGILLIMLIEVGMYYAYTQYAAPSAAGAETVMKAVQRTALACAQRRADLKPLYGPFVYGYTNGGEPGSEIRYRGLKRVCDGGEGWRYLPSGWAYDPIKDLHVADGTFEFSARNRDGDSITCTHKGCSYLSASGDSAVMPITSGT